MPADGVLSFARFMELALYCPVYGFYEKETDNIGRDGDFYTNVSTGSLFGELLAFQFAEWLQEFKIQNSKFKIAEAGAHDGKLAKDILTWLQLHRPRLFEQIEYDIIEPSIHRQNWQRETLKEFSNVRWFTEFKDLSLAARPSPLHGVIFSNELLDAMPVHRFGWDAKGKKWFEWGVALEGETFVWAKMQNSESDSPSSIFHLPPSLQAALPDGYIIEFSPDAENWWRDAAQALTHGKLLTLDYGFTQTELFSPARTNGTLRGYRAHHYVENILANPGEQDITAHVNFAAIQASGEQAGLKTEELISQSQFLTRVVERMTRNGKTFDWTPARARQLQTLTHPEHLGRAFRVLVQSR